MSNPSHCLSCDVPIKYGFFCDICEVAVSSYGANLTRREHERSKLERTAQFSRGMLIVILGASMLQFFLILFVLLRGAK